MSVRIVPVSAEECTLTGGALALNSTFVYGPMPFISPQGEIPNEITLNFDTAGDAAAKVDVWIDYTEDDNEIYTPYLWGSGDAAQVRAKNMPAVNQSLSVSLPVKGTRGHIHVKCTAGVSTTLSGLLLQRLFID